MNIGEVLIFSYTGAVQTLTLEPGTYKFECWGAQGGKVAGAAQSLGGYAVGEVTFDTSKVVNIYVGGAGASLSAGWNGGGYGLYGGGGASDIRVDGNALTDRVIVAGAGAGSGSSTSRLGGNGGGLVGQDGYGTGGTQTAGGSRLGAFGTGGSIGANYGGGGGGWYGGGSADYLNRGGGGGSSYIGDAVTTQGFNFPRIPLSNASTTTGVRTGNGEIKITKLSGGVTPVTKKRRFVQII